MPARPPLSYLVRENSYHRMDEAEHRQMFVDRGDIKTKDEFEAYIAAFCERKYMSGFMREMNRTAKRYLEHFRRGK